MLGDSVLQHRQLYNSQQQSSPQQQQQQEHRVPRWSISNRNSTDEFSELISGKQCDCEKSKRKSSWRNFWKIVFCKGT